MKTSVITPIGMPFVHSELITDDKILKDQKERSKQIVEEHNDGWGAQWADDCGSWNSVDLYNNILEEEEVFSVVLDDLGDVLNAFTKAMRMDWSNMSSVVMESWLNANPPGNVQECHTHPHCYIACVYYIHVPEDGGEFVLDNPLSYEHDVGCSSSSPYTDKTIDVKSGDLIMFPSNMEHHTRVNLSDEYRYSLAFNLSTEELMPEFLKTDKEAPWV